MMRNILVGYDGSESAVHALSFAAGTPRNKLCALPKVATSITSSLGIEATRYLSVG
jgi:hypothetical protein